jgi:hypothetical protein
MGVCKYCGKEINNDKAWGLDSELNGYHIECLIDKEFSEEGECIIHIPNNATNGDVIKALFPDMATMHRFGIRLKKRNASNGEEQLSGIANTDWWNAPYKESE